MDLGHIKKYLLKNMLTGLIKTIITAILTLIALPLTIKNVGIETYGIISIVLVFASFTGVLDLGLSKSLILLQGKQEENNPQKEITAIYIINLGMFLIVFCFAILVYLLDINLLGQNISVENEMMRLINSIALFILSFDILNNLLRASLESKFKLHWVTWGFVLQSAIINMGWLILSFMKVPLSYYLFVPIGSSIAVLLFHLIILPPVYNTLKKPDMNSFKNVFKITLQFFKIGALNSIHLPAVKYALILFVGDSRSIGLFELTTRLALLTNNFLSYLSNPIFSLASYHNVNNKEYLWQLTKKITSILALTSLVGYLFFILFNKIIILFFYKEYSPYIFNVLNYILIGFLFTAVSESIQKYFLGIGNIRKVINIKLFGILITIVLISIFEVFSIFNLKNLAISYSISLIVISTIYLFSLKKSSAI